MTSDLRAFYEHYVASANARDYDAIAELVHDEVIINGYPCKREDVLDGLRSFTEIMPNFVWKIEDLLVSDDRIAARLTDTGTPVREWLGIKAVGVKLRFTEFASYRVREGRFAEMWFLMDIPAAMEQIRAGSMAN